MKQPSELEVRRARRHYVSTVSDLVMKIVDIIGDPDHVTFGEAYEFLTFKAEIMSQLIGYGLACHINSCPFCIATDLKCEECSYRLTHGKCTDNVSIVNIFEEVAKCLRELLKAYSSSKPSPDTCEEVADKLKHAAKNLEDFANSLRKKYEEEKQNGRND